MQSLSLYFNDPDGNPVELTTYEVIARRAARAARLMRHRGAAMPRSTKIVATLGPASSDPLVLERMLAAGVDVVRFNFSHGSAEDHLERARARARGGRTDRPRHCDHGRPARVRRSGSGKFKGGRVTLRAGAPFVLDAQHERGNEQRVGLDYKDLPKDVRAGDTLLLNDGLIVLDVERVEGSEIHTTVRIGGVLSDNKGINKRGGGLSAPALTGKDVRDIETAMQCGADYVAVSFVKNRTDVEMARQLATIAGEKHGVKPQIIAKIERAEAIPLLQARSWRPPTASWSRAVISRSRSATPRCRRYRSA